MKVSWITDLHLNFCDDEVVQDFVAGMQEEQPDIVLVGGDVGECDSYAGHLEQIAQAVRVPVYFVLGNHDAYRGSIREMREKAVGLTEKSEWLRWLPATDVVELTPEAGLVGQGGWGDGRLGSYYSSTVRLNDFKLIEELKSKSRDELLFRLIQLGRIPHPNMAST
jgi:Icc protein